MKKFTKNIKSDKYNLTKKWGSFDLTGAEIDNNIIELLIDFSRINNRFRIGEYFETDAVGNKRFYSLDEIYTTYKNSTYFEGNYPFTVDVVRDIHLFVKNNEPILLEYDTRIINRFNKLINTFNPPTAKIYLNKLAIKRIKGSLDNFEILLKEHKITFLWNTVRIETL